MKDFWEDNRVQFTRLLAEIHAVGLSPQQWTQLSESMNLDPTEIDALFQRAEQDWEVLKTAAVEHPGEPVYFDEQLDAAVALLDEFLQGMPELGVRDSCQQEREIVRSCYRGSDHDYIRDSFAKFLEQEEC